MTFEELNIKKYFKTNLRELGLRDLTLIQERTFPAVMSGRDVMGIAQTGTGKTISYLLPSLNLWKFSPKHEPQILILVPTRELVVQVVEQAEKLAKDSSIMVAGVWGGVGIQPQAARIREGADVVVGTPGRILDIALQGSLRFGGIRRLILDEVDEMLEQGFRTQIGRVLDLLPRKRQNLMFSATMNKEIEDLADTFFNGPLKIEAAPMGTPLENIRQEVIDVPNFNTKINLLTHLLGTDEEMTRVMVFVCSIAMADMVYERLTESLADAEQDGARHREVDYLHSRRTQSQRFSALRSFREGKTDVLIATDLIARGIDVEGVSHVICFDMPFEPEQYIHRIGRTGRVRLAKTEDGDESTICVEEGHAISFCTPNEQTALANIEGLMKSEVPHIEMPESVEISEVLIESEMPQVRMRNSLTEIDSTPGAAFHERSEKNKKTNHRVSHRTLMRKKYGKPIKRRPKK